MRKNLEKLKIYLYDTNNDIQERSFVLLSIVALCAMVVATVFGVAEGQPILATMSCGAGVVAFSIVLFIGLKTNKLKFSMVLISSMLIFAFLPVTFFTNGGIYSGTPIWFSFTTLYIVMILSGGIRIFFLISEAAIVLVCWYVGYTNPDSITYFSHKGAYLDSIGSLVVTGAVMVVLISFQNSLYKKENEIAREKTKEVEELNKAQNRFFSSMSHEIRTPINTVLGLNEIILRQPDASDEIRQDATNIQGAGKMLLSLINDILDVSKIEAGKMEIVPVDYNVGSMVSEVVNMVHLKADEKELEFNVDIDPSMPSVLFGDEVRIKQVLLNLLSNAVKYTREGYIGLHMESEEKDEDNVILKITVSDSGKGIQQESLPYIFDTFKRTDEEENRNIEGTGLGLSIVKQLIELMDGKITVNSVYNQGTSFMITLPQRISSRERLGDFKISAIGEMQRNKRYEAGFTAPDARILIIDDNEMNLLVEAKLLKDTEMEIDLARSGDEALELTMRYNYDAIFMDHLMPDMDGIDCYKQIRRQTGGLNRDVPMVVITANADPENKALYHLTGFDGSLIKPVTGQQLEDSLRSILPKEKLIIKDNELTRSKKQKGSSYYKKVPVKITTSSMSDIPESVLKELQIATIPFSIMTDKGLFYDGVEAVSDEIIRYLEDGNNRAVSDPPSEDDFTDFFSEQLKEAHHVIHIAITTSMSEEFFRAENAARKFENVTVINSEAITAASGLLTLIAYRLAQQNIPAEKIIKELDEVKKKIHCSFVIADSSFMARSGRIGRTMNRVMKSLWVRPSIRIKDDVSKVDRVLMGGRKQCYEHYIRYTLPLGLKADKDLLVVAYADLSEEYLVWLEEMIKRRADFKNIVFQKTSAAISLNCGPGTFGLFFLEETGVPYHLGSFFQNDASIARTEEETDKKEQNKKDQNKKDQNTGDYESRKKWYDGIPGIDANVALKNTGSEDAFKTVLNIFYDAVTKKEAELWELLEKEDIENFTIRVHALKSSARLIGAVHLGDGFESLEKAGKEKDVNFIKENIDSVLFEYRDLRKELVPIFGQEETEEVDLPEAEDFRMKEFYKEVRFGANDMDIDVIKNAFSKLEGYKIPESDKERFNTIKEKYEMFDYTGVLYVLDEGGTDI